MNVDLDQQAHTDPLLTTQSKTPEPLAQPSQHGPAPETETHLPTFPKGHANKATHTSNARMIGTLAPPSTTVPIKVTYTYSAGDGHTLRGIPAIGFSVSGAVPGSIPHIHGIPD